MGWRAWYVAEGGGLVVGYVSTCGGFGGMLLWLGGTGGSGVGTTSWGLEGVALWLGRADDAWCSLLWWVWSGRRCGDAPVPLTAVLPRRSIVV